MMRTLCSLHIMCGVWEEKAIRENTAACGVRKLMQPVEPQFVRLSLFNEQLRKSHRTTCLPHTQRLIFTLQIYIMKCAMNAAR